MRIELIQKWGDYAPGTILEPHPHIVKTLLDAGIARAASKPIDEPPIETETAQANPDGERAVDDTVKPPRRRRRNRKAAKKSTKAAKAKDAEEIDNGDDGK